ncbi:hypothetical protein EDC01DRAFT_252464 [Geopyxis carbonaria]|nr:hypothetical protein EDC01DRAFT_252464 [Geopyxis carbonaria]
MQFPAPTVLCVLLAALATAASPLLKFDSRLLISSLTTEKIEAIAPKSATCPPVPQGAVNECRTAGQALVAIDIHFGNWTSIGEGAALLSTMAFESDDFRFNRKKVPGRAVQGTRAMLTAKWVRIYAKYVSSVLGLSSRLGYGNEIDDSNGEAALQAVWADTYSFGAAGWYLLHTSEFNGGCPSETRLQLNNEGWAGFENYVTKCLRRPMDEKRKQKWCMAVMTLKPDNMVMPAECSTKT